jgi:hypothetical protein
MKKQLIAFIGLTFTFLLGVSQLVSNPTGAPRAASGGPSEGGVTCSQGGCHFGTSTDVSNIITTDIPVGGYTPGTTYNITVTVSGSGQKGLMVSAQNASGNFLGSFISGPGSKVVFTDYITHTNSKSTSPAVWNFQWIAPATGTGAVTFYGAFAITRNTTQKQSITVQENLNTSISESIADFKLAVFPNPVSDFLTISFNLKQTENTTIRLVSMDGKESITLLKGLLYSGQHENKFDVTSVKQGLYLLNINTPTGNTYQKIMIGG